MVRVGPCALQSGGARADIASVDISAERGAGDPDVDALYRRLQPSLLRYLTHLHAEHAEDLAADVWAEVVHLLPRFEGNDDAFRAWLFTLARRRLIDSYRRAGRRRTEPLSHDVEAASGGPDDEAIGRVDVEETVDGLYERLPADQAEVVVLRVVGGLSVATVARITGKQPGHVRVLQHRALRRLRRTA